MQSTIRRALLGIAFACVAAAAIHGADAAQPDDACALLTQAQVSAALGSPVAAGTYVTPTFKKTCTWSAIASGIGSITLNLQNGDSFEGAKQMAQTVSRGKALFVPVGGVGDDAYFFGSEKLVGLIVKKGKVAFKVAVYVHISAEKQQAIEQALARQVIAKL